MTGALILAIGLACGAPPVVAADTTSDPAAIWRAGESYAAYTGRFSTRKQEWETRDGWAAIPDSLVARTKALPVTLRVLAVADENCGDSMNSMPYLARLASLAGTIDLHFVNSQRGHAIMEAYRTPDGRAATPTLVVLDARDRVVGCWVERPEKLLRWSKIPKDSLPANERFSDRRAWYANDKGQSALAEWVPMLERIARGETVCAAGAAPRN